MTFDETLCTNLEPVTHTLCVYNYTYIIYAYVLETFSQLSESTHGLCFTIYSFSVSGIVPVSSVQLQVCTAVGASLSIIYHMYDTYIQSSNMSIWHQVIR